MMLPKALLIKLDLLMLEIFGTKTINELKVTLHKHQQNKIAFSISNSFDLSIGIIKAI